MLTEIILPEKQNGKKRTKKNKQSQKCLEHLSSVQLYT